MFTSLKIKWFTGKAVLDGRLNIGCFGKFTTVTARYLTGDYFGKSTAIKAQNLMGILKLVSI